MLMGFNYTLKDKENLSLHFLGILKVFCLKCDIFNVNFTYKMTKCLQYIFFPVWFTTYKNI